MKRCLIILTMFFIIFISCAEKEDELEKENEKNENYQNKNININLNSDNKTNLYDNKDINYKEEEISHFETKIVDQNEDRLHNIKLACDKITGKTLMPGETFSFNDTVGKAETERGFKPAKVLINKEVTIGEGGGICQVSTTVFNAVDSLEMEIIERHEHSKDVSYVAEGRDATVAFGSQDFRFKNNKSYMIKIDISVEEGYVKCKIIKMTVE